MFSLEALVDADPDIILLPAWMSVDDFVAEKPYSELTAAKEGHIYNVDGNLFERQGPRSIEGIELIAQYIADVDVADEAA